MAIDDTPSKRYGPKVEGAGIHHNPTPGPAGAKFVYGQVWVTLAWVVRHPLWGAIGLPLLARMYVRQKDIDAQLLHVPPQGHLPDQAGDGGRTGGLGGAMAAKSWVGPLWVVADGAYAKRAFLQAAAAARVIVVSRLRKDAALFDVPGRAAEAAWPWPTAEATARRRSVWPSGPASGAVGRWRRSCCTGSR